MSDLPESDPILQELCASQPLAVLATDAGGAPYTSLVALAVTPDLRKLYFATPRASRKWANLAQNRQVSLLIDNRSNLVSDFSQAAAATILGSAQELTGAERETGLSLFLARHPHLKEFTDSPDCALFQVQVASVHLVTCFQSVRELHFTH
jgi:heme iron utilization protein